MTPTAEVTSVTAETAALLERVATLDCAAAPNEGANVVASVTCDSGEDALGNVALETIEDTATLRTTWQSTVGDTVSETDDACTGGTSGSRKWGFGNIACEVDRNGARLAWTDARIGLLGSIESSEADIAPLFAWWQANGRKIGRSADTAIPAPADDAASGTGGGSGSTKKGKLVRVPGRPNDITCAAVGDAIPDEWDRAWQLTTIDFQNHAGYERLVLNLKRTGKNNTRWNTQALVERMARSKVRSAVPNAPKSDRGRVAIVVRLDGFRDAPNLYSFRPKGLDYVKEVSLVRDGHGRALVISAPLGTCYQMRIPVWGPDATGKERTAGIFIDLRPR